MLAEAAGQEELRRSEINGQPFPALGTPLEIIGHFGGRDRYREALSELERELYSAASSVEAREEISTRFSRRGRLAAR